MLITTCGNSNALAKQVVRQLNAQKRKARYSPLTISHFPDRDLYLKFNTEVKGQTVVIIQSFQPKPDQSLLRVLFAAYTAKDLGAKKVILVAPYLAYMRQDARFNPGEAVSSKIVGSLLSKACDRIITFDPHIHRYKSIRDVFSCAASRLTANGLMADYIGRKFKNNVVIIGPDWESYQWAEHIAKKIGAPVTIFRKKRLSSYKVQVRMVAPVPLKGKKAIIVDDIISTGHTMVEAAKQLRKAGVKSISAVCVHPLFVGKALQKMRKAGISHVVSTNCIEHHTNKIDVSGMVVEELEKER